MEPKSFNAVFSYHGRSHVALLTSSDVTWYQEDQKEQKFVQKKDKTVHKVLLEEVVSVSYETEFERNKKKGKTNEIELFPTNCFSISYIARTRNHRWKCKRAVFQCMESTVCQRWVETIRGVLSGFNRPKKLLVFINPVGGRKQANRIFNEKVHPLFVLADIKQDIIVTERANHAQNYLMTTDLSDYDGVVAVGGDGMFSEVLNGILATRPPSTENDITAPSIKIGLIPAGSTDTIVFCTSGINDPVTSALHIILGDSLSLDVCSVWHEGKFLKYSVSLMGYGFFGDVIKNSEQLRWMGPRRYDLAGFRSFMENRAYSGEIKYLPVSVDPQERQICTAGCQRCAEEDESPFNEDPESWETVQGQFISIIGANITCRCAKSLDGISPNAHLGDGLFDLILIRKTSRLQHLRHMIRVASKGDAFGFDFINVFRVKEFQFRPLPSSTEAASNLRSKDANSHDYENDNLVLKDVLRSPDAGTNHAVQGVWNIDGELVDKSNLHVRNHRKLITMFARGIEMNNGSITCRGCRSGSLTDG